ncbi:MAG: hypothetical protein CL840_21680 [Crocinitomicaceae bacterium]|nr:hypothetical protein [Crocinitomicaceae bacterium]|tara:strand:+ start:5119 stop:7341 length:2223 start_codon:yes stop_codon:yes gene_type:complete
MKNLKEILLIIAITSVYITPAFAQTTKITEDECLALQEIYGVKRVSKLSSWVSPTTGGTMSQTDCNCSNSSDRPSYNQAKSFVGVIIDDTDGISSLNLYDLLDSVPAGILDGSQPGLDSLRYLTLGNIGQYIVSGSDKLPPVFTSAALPNLIGLYWYDESDWTKLPLLTSTLLPKLESINYRGMTGLNAIATSRINEIQNREDLKAIYLEGLEFNGALGKLPNIMEGSKNTLKQVRLYNSFTDDGGNWWPASIGDHKYSELTEFRLEDNHFPYSQIDDLTTPFFIADSFPKLKELYLKNNQFGDSNTVNLPASIFKLSKLKTLDISTNDIEGPIVPMIVSVCSLETYLAHENEFDNPIPTDLPTKGTFYYMTELKKLQLMGCTLTCELSNLDLQLSTKLESLTFSNNLLTGEVPSYYGTAFQLKEFRCDFNLLYDMPVLPSTLEILRMNNNYFDLDDVYNAANASSEHLAYYDDETESNPVPTVINSKIKIHETNFIISPQYNKLRYTGKYDMVNEAFPPSKWAMTLTAENAGVDNGPRDYLWLRVKGAIIDTADGDNDSLIYDWPNENIMLGNDSGYTWFCQVHITEPDSTTGFYEELTMEVGHTEISYNEETDPCSFVAPPTTGPSALIIYSGNSTGGSQPSSVASSIDEIAEEESRGGGAKDQFKVYPNPTNRSLMVSADQDIFIVRLYTMNGRLVKEQPVNGRSASILVEEFDEGIYILKAEIDSGSLVKRVIKLN